VWEICDQSSENSHFFEAGQPECNAWWSSNPCVPSPSLSLAPHTQPKPVEYKMWPAGRATSADGAQIALAKSLCGALHRLVATGVLGPRNCIQRVFLAAPSESILRVLRTVSDTSRFGKRRAGIESHSTSRHG
jgi:hypothetical protein